MNYKATILALDNDQPTQKIIKDFLEQEGYRMVAAGSEFDLMNAIRSCQPDMVLLSKNSTDWDDPAIIIKIKEQYPIPVIVLNDNDNTIDKVVELEMGADDYLAKPFELKELSARIKANLRLVKMVEETITEHNNIVENADIIEVGDWCLDQKKLQLFDEKGKSAGLTFGEFKLFQILALSPNQVFSRDQLFEITRDGNLGTFDRAIDIQIGRIRKKIGDNSDKPRYIKTVRGAGYMLVMPTNVLK